MKINRKFLLVFRVFSILVVVGVFYFAHITWKSLQGPITGGDFALTYKGLDWTFSSQAKKLNLIYFGYTKCPDVCPMSLSFAGEAFRRLSRDELEEVRFLFLSVDHAHDNPIQVAEFAQNFYPTFIGLSGTQEQIDKTIGMFSASYLVEENSKSYLGYSISHTDRIFFLNSKGIVVDSISGSKEGTEFIYKKIKEYL